MTRSKITGVALILGSILYFVANGILTPLMPLDLPGPELFASSIFLQRLSVATASVFFLLVGAIGIYSRQSHNTGWFGAIAYGLTFVGCVFVFAHEWGQVFFLHELAKVAPEGLQALEDIEGANLYDLETILGLSLFMVGWILFAISTLLARVFKPFGPWLLIAGFVAVPILAAMLPGLWGFMAGNVVVAAGWFFLGLELTRSQPD